MAKANDEPPRGPGSAQPSSSEPAAAQPPSGGGAPRPTLLDRMNNFFGHLVGSSGQRRGARDTDPGH